MRTRWSQVSRVRSRRPGPSAPSTSPSGRPRRLASAWPASSRRLAVQPQQHIAHAAQLLHRLGQIGDPQIGLAFQRARGGLGQRAGLGRGMAGGAITARAPNTSAERRTAPTLCGSVTRSSSTTSGRPGPEMQQIREAAPVQRPHLQRGALMHRIGAMGTGNLRGSTISGVIPLAAMASASLSAALRSPPAAAFRAPGSAAHRAPHAGRTARRFPPPGAAGAFLVDHPGRFLHALSPTPAPGQMRARQLQGPPCAIPGPAFSP
jgi:hypothetical protein